MALLSDPVQQRFAAVQSAAQEQSEAVGEADLRRLKRQFSSLKNTFLHFEVKNEFLAGKGMAHRGQLSFIPLAANLGMATYQHVLPPMKAFRITHS
jgi:hypothetical protein